MAVISVLYLVVIGYYVWAIATHHMVEIRKPERTIAYGILFAVGIGLIVTRPLLPKMLAFVVGLLMSGHAYLVLRHQRENPST